ncbi:hypothetical protein [Streptomyces liangshanensis]|uniref:Uncharacterized protein n=1 Tax=Streptomyces liangshanensis TaxID=2717324 RepID=A0A6G9GVF9_9ACTN|nr:hypothetical protein [Streptomyces liangshanensis]QIQ02039.1 hypothetical protein HA039_06755 [Streptomyces liangshanensis]
MDEMTVPAAGMRVSVRIRQDVVIADPERFLAAARAAHLELSPDATEETAAEDVRDVHDAVFALLGRFGGLAAGSPDTTPPAHAGAPTPVRPDGLRPDGLRPDGLRPAGEFTQVVLDDPLSLVEYGCFPPEDPFALPSGS